MAVSLSSFQDANDDHRRDVLSHLTRGAALRFEPLLLINSSHMQKQMIRMPATDPAHLRPVATTPSAKRLGCSYNNANDTPRNLARQRSRIRDSVTRRTPISTVPPSKPRLGQPYNTCILDCAAQFERCRPQIIKHAHHSFELS